MVVFGNGIEYQKATHDRIGNPFFFFPGKRRVGLGVKLLAQPKDIIVRQVVLVYPGP